MKQKINIQKNFWLCSLVALLAFLLFAGAASAFTVTQDAVSTPSGDLVPGEQVSSHMKIRYYDGDMSASGSLSLKTDLVGQSWTVNVLKGGTVITTLHPSYSTGYSIDGFSLSGYSSDIDLSIIVAGTVASDSAGTSISTIKLSESGGSESGLKTYTSPAQSVVSSQVTTTVTPTNIQATGKATAVETPTATPNTATKTPHPTLSQPNSSSSASKSTFNTTTLIIIISALVVIIAGTVIIVRLTKRPKKTEKATVTKVEQKDIHVTVNGNVYSDVGVVASDNAIVNRPTVTNELKKTCPNCGAELKDDDKFCSKCGKQL